MFLLIRPRSFRLERRSQHYEDSDHLLSLAALLTLTHSPLVGLEAARTDFLESYSNSCSL